MKPIFSDEERTQAVRNFVVARYHKQAKITDFSALALYLNEGRIRILCELEKSGQITVHERYVTGLQPVFTERDAETYFEWLVATVTGGVENVSEDIMKRANNQLFQIIHVLGDSIHMEKTVQLLSPYNWQELFVSFDQKLTEVHKIIDKGEKDIAETLSKILMWMKKYSPALNRLQKEDKRLFGRQNK